MKSLIIIFCDIITGLNIITESDISPNIGFHRASTTGVACQQGTLTPPDTWSRPFWTCICSTCWDQSFFRTCRYFYGLCSSNIPRYFLDFASLKCSYHCVSTSPTFVRSLPSLSLIFVIFTMPDTLVIWPLFSTDSESHASPSSQWLLPFLMLRFTFLSISTPLLTLSDLVPSIFAVGTYPFCFSFLCSWLIAVVLLCFSRSRSICHQSLILHSNWGCWNDFQLYWEFLLDLWNINLNWIFRISLIFQLKVEEWYYLHLLLYFPLHFTPSLLASACFGTFGTSLFNFWNVFFG